MKINPFCLLFLAAAAGAESPSYGSRKLVVSEKGTVSCHLYEMDGFREDNSEVEEEILLCETKADQEDGIGFVYEIELPNDFIEKHKALIESGDAILTATHATKTRSYDSRPDTIQLTADSVLSVTVDRRLAIPTENNLT